MFLIVGFHNNYDLCMNKSKLSWKYNILICISLWYSMCMYFYLYNSLRAVISKTQAGNIQSSFTFVFYQCS